MPPVWNGESREELGVELWFEVRGGLKVLYRWESILAWIWCAVVGGFVLCGGGSVLLDA